MRDMLTMKVTSIVQGPEQMGEVELLGSSFVRAGGKSGAPEFSPLCFRPSVFPPNGHICPSKDNLLGNNYH